MLPLRNTPHLYRRICSETTRWQAGATFRRRRLAAVVAHPSAYAASKRHLFTYSSPLLDRRAVPASTTSTSTRRRNPRRTPRTMNATEAEVASQDLGGQPDEGTADASTATTTTATTRATRPPQGMGWQYDEVDPATGDTALDTLYRSHLDRIRRILEQPLPPIPRDGHVHPDFFVGFGHYHHRLRDEYRALIARALQVPVAAVRLSVAWSGRFDVTRFARVQKVCGVSLDRTLLQCADGATAAHHSNRQAVRSVAECAVVGERKAEEEATLPADVTERISAFVATVNTRRSEALLHAQLLQASEAIPEVEFALSRREHRLLSHLHNWLQTKVLRRSLAVVVYGGGEAAASPPSSSSRGCTGTPPPSSSTPREIEAALRTSRQSAAIEAAQQRRYIEQRWLKAFHSRRTVPQMVSLTSLATLVARAVLVGEVSPALTIITETGDSGDTRTSSELLPTSVVAMLEQLRVPLLQGNELAETADPEAVERPLPPEAWASDVFGDDATLSALPLNTQAAAASWLRLVQDAVFLHGAGVVSAAAAAGSCRASSLTGTSSGTPDGLELHTTTMGADGPAAPPSSDVGATRCVGQLPALFVHGAYAGGLREMQYLQRNKAAMDALLLHPNDVVIKKAFASRMRNGHQRLRMHEEVASALH